MSYPELERLLYHGSTVEVRDIDVAAGAKRKDFGQGFYTTTSREQAEKFTRLKSKYRSADFGYVTVYEYVHNPKLKIQRFNDADMQWLEFIIQNREPRLNEPRLFTEAYDIVIGPVADDAVGLVVNNFLAGVYGDKTTAEAKRTAVRLLESEKLRNQVFFGTKKGADCLRVKEAYRVAANR